MHPLVTELTALLSLERLEVNLFRGQSRDIGTRYVFGGQVLGQAASAAQQTVTPERALHSLHAYFLRAGDIEHPIVYQVETSRDGGSFSVRRVTAIQHGQPIFVASASFQRHEEGLDHQMSGPDVPKPEDIEPPAPLSANALARLPAKTQRWLTRSGPFEFRTVYPRDEIKPAKRPPHNYVWVRLIDRIRDDATLHRALLAYVSDFHLIGTITFPHGLSYLSQEVQMASLDHAIWFHRPFQVDDWLLYVCDSPNAHGGRGLARGAFYSRDGVLVASTAQEGLMRIVTTRDGS